MTTGNITNIKISSLVNIGGNLDYTSTLPIDDLNANPIVTRKANVQILGNYILNQAGSANFVQAAQATLAQSVVNAAQPNITSVGTLTSLDISGDLTIDVASLKISGGNSGYVLQTDGHGNLSWTAQTGNGGGNGTPNGANTQVQFNDAGSFGGNSGFTFNKTTGIFTAPFLAGDGNGLANIRGSNVIGAIGLATYATTANSVAGANVSGAVQYATTANSVAVGNVSGLGNIATINLTGSNSNVLYGNGVFAPASGGSNANTGNIGFNNNVIYSLTGVVVNNSDLANGQTAGISIPAQGDGNAVSLYNTYGNVTLLAGNVGNSQNVQTWSFGADGNTTFPNGIEFVQNQIRATNDNDYLSIKGYSPTEGDGYTAVLYGGDAGSTGNSNVYTGGQARITGGRGVNGGIGGQVRLRTYDANSSNDWYFKPDGNLELPDGTVLQNGGGIEFPSTEGEWDLHSSDGKIYIGSLPSSMAYIDTYDANISVRIRTLGDPQEGPGYDWIFDPTGNLTLPTNTFSVNYANGQRVQLGGGNANTGNFIFDTLDLDGTTFDEIALTGTNSGNIIVNAPGLAMVIGGYESGGMVTDGSNTYLFNGDPSFVNGIPQPGVGYTWQFDNTGNTILPGAVVGNGNLILQPDVNTGGAYLDVYLTGGPDIHIAGNGETVIVGSDAGANVSVQASGNVAIQANAVFGGNSHTWMFDYYGNITLPGNTFSVNYANGQQVQLGGGANLGNFEFPNPTSNTSTITVNDGSDIVINPTYGGSSPAYINVPGNINGPTTEPLQIYNSYFAGNANAAAVSIGADVLKGITIFGDGSVVASNTVTVPASDSGSIIFSSDGTSNNGSLKVDSGYNMTVSANSNFYIKRASSDRLAITDTNTDLMASSNVVIHANKAGSEQNWTFDTTGKLTTPGDIDMFGGVINFHQQVGNITWGSSYMAFSQYGRINTNVDFFANSNVIGAQYLKGDGSNISNISISGGTNPISTSGNVTAGNVTSNGSVTANTFVGNISGSNVTGTVANANYSVYSGTASVANSVAAANISGTINLANYATTANSVAGANVSGAVAYATTANSVAVANVSGIGNIATINKDGNSSNILYGNGVFASAPVTYGNSNVATFLASYGSNTITTTGNVTAGNANLGNAVTANYHIGNLYGTANLAVYATTANAVAGANVSGQVGNALVAGTVYTNAQPNITSVGTLTSLAVTGNITNGNVTGGNLVSANYLTGTLTTAAQPNITSTGTLTSLSVTGNVSAGNVILNGQTVALTGAVNPDYIQVEKSADQTFVAKNADINFNVTTATNGGIAYATNIFTLTAGKTYLLEATLCVNTFTSTSAFIWWSWVDATTNAQLDTSNGGAVSTGSSGVAIPATWTANDNYSSTAKLIYTPNTTQTVKLRATDGSGTCTVVAVGTRASIVQINPTASLSAVSTINASGNISVGGNLTVAGNVIGNVIGTSPNVTLVAGSYSYTFDNTGNFTLPANSDILMTGVNSILSAGGTTLLGGYSQVGGYYSTLGVKYPGAGTQFGMTLQPTNDNTTAINFLNAAGNNIGSITQTASTVTFTGDGSGLSNVATQTTGSWTLAAGTNTVSLSVPINGIYLIWVKGNIPNGIVTYTATVVVTNTNVPVLGTSYGWYYAAGNALVLTAIPTQIVGTLNNISNAVVSTTTANVFTFGITNNSGTSQVVSYGWTELG
jgi:hypothetical protein